MAIVKDIYIMTKNQVLRYFKQNKSAIARAAGCSRQAVSQWGGTVPPLAQLKLETATKGSLKASLDCWDKLLRINPKDPSHAIPATASTPKRPARRSRHPRRR